MGAPQHVTASPPAQTAPVRTAALICSPRARRDAAVLSALAAAGIDVAESVEVESLSSASPQGRAWREHGIEVAIAAGGDGTIGSVATQIVGSDLLLGILPLGTSNDIARSLNIPLDLSKAAEVIASGVATIVDAGRVLPADATDADALASHGPYFLHALTLGVNVEFARLATDLVRRRRWGRLNYAAAAVEAAASFEPIEATLRLEGVERRSQFAAEPDERGAVMITQRVAQIAAVNLSIFGGALNLALRGVEPRDRLLDIVVIEAPSMERVREVAQGWLDALRDSRGRGRARNVVRTGSSEAADLASEIAGLPIPGVTRYQARAAILETPSPVDVTLDGEIRARTPLRVEATPAMVRALLPRPASKARANMVRYGE